MKRRLLGALLLSSCLASGVEVGIALANTGRAPVTQSTQPCAAHAHVVAVNGTQSSLFQLTTRWTTADDTSVTLADLRGNYGVLALVFTRCPSVCPTLVKDLQRVEQALPDVALARTKFVLVSIDPEHDTPAVLRDYREKMGLDPQHWLLLRGTPDQVRELSATLGASYGSGQGQALTHSRLITLLDPQGDIVHQRLGLGEPRTFSDLIQTSSTPS